MKTRKYKFIGIALFMLCQHIGCKDFVDLKSPTVVNRDEFFKRQSDFTAAVNGLYSNLRSYYNGFYVVGEIPSDNTEANGYTLGFADMDQQTWLSNNSSIQGSWLSAYSAIARANIILGRIDGVTMDAALKEQYKAEAKFVRALMYFNLTQFFGDVPLVLQEVKTEAEAYTYLRETSDKIYAQIETDLLDAIAGLPATYTGADIGRAAKGAAQGLLGKVYVTHKKFDKAIPVLEDVIGSGNYKLEDSYEGLFKVENRNNKEMLFSVQYLGNGNGEGSNFCITFAPFGSGTEITTGGNPAGANQGTLDLFNAFEAGDLRKSVAIAEYPLTKALYTRKFMDRPIAANEGNNNWPVLRYADVLLLYAEALNENGATDDAFGPLNEVRERADLGDLSGLDKIALRAAIQQERRVELCFEGHRWFDLLRTGNMVSVMTAYKEKYKGIAYLVEYYDVNANKALFPVPFRERNLNPNLTQNPGYN
ncbi:RagB/SusD family nutrient uptake outer membrane protein [Chitinophaga sp. MM2321]|uniref:RagB/SusD family nutrient uptake outer membrane protein n=1 Tax=Chitinophaga sp. MM2321 TaxID=3137178 RepID=UPI0032D586B8